MAFELELRMPREAQGGAGLSIWNCGGQGMFRALDLESWRPREAQYLQLRIVELQ